MVVDDMLQRINCPRSWRCESVLLPNEGSGIQSHHSKTSFKVELSQFVNPAAIEETMPLRGMGDRNLMTDVDVYQGLKGIVPNAESRGAPS